jgi:hypothetical protein
MYAEGGPELVNLVQSFLNNSLLTRPNKRTLMINYSGHAKTTPLALMIEDNVPVNEYLDFIKRRSLWRLRSCRRL